MNTTGPRLMLCILLLSSMTSSATDFMDVYGDGKSMNLEETGMLLTAETRSDSIPYPWSEVDLTAAEAKVISVAPPVVGGAFPWLPVIGGVVGVGTIVYFMVEGDDEGDPVDCAFTASAVPTASSCGLSNGGVSVIVNPQGSYTYLWSNGAVTSNLVNIPAGNYAVTITRTGTTCSQVLQTTVTNNDQTFSATISAQDTDCDQQNGAVSVTPSPPGAYTYLWSNGATTQNQTNLPAGTYTVTVSAGGTCTLSRTAQIGTIPFEPTVTFTTTPSSCGGSDGSATVSVNPPDQYTYTWSNGQSGAEASGLTAGSYAVTVSKPGTTCTHVANVIVDDIPASFSVSVTSTAAGCGLSDGTATVIVDPPGTYDYTWSNGQTGAQLSGLAAGAYTVTVSISGTACAQEATTNISEAPPSFVVSLSSTQASCGLSDGTATATVDQPGAYDYLWSNGQSGFQVTGLAPGSYTVTVTLQGTDCAQQGSITVQSAPFPYSISITTTPSSCGGSDGGATATVTPQGELDYQWSNGQTGNQLSNVNAGTYSVTVTVPGTTCTQTATTTIDELPSGFTVNLSTTPSGCGLNDGTATATVDPPGNYDYQWSNGQTGNQLSGVGGGSYTVTVTISGTNCSQETTATIEELPPGFTVNVTSTPAGCGLNNGTASAIVDPPGNYDYIWSNGQTGSQLSGVMAGFYTVTVSVAGTSCSQQVGTTIDELPPTFTLSFTSTPAGCGQNNGSATVMVDPPGAYSYLWSNGAMGSQINNVGSGVYGVTVTVAGTSCSSSGTVNVDQTGGGFTATFTTDNADCGVSNGSATITVSPPAEYTYLWSNQQTGNMLMQVVSGSYSVTVTDINACSESFSVDVGEDPAEYITIINTIPGTCTGGGNISFTVTTPGTGPMNIEITGPAGTTTITVGPGVYNLSTFMTVIPGTYSMTVTDQQIGPACSETVSATVADNTPPIDLLDDFYATGGTQPVEENALENDEGFNIQMTQVDNEDGGTVNFTADGNFVFIADIGFSGEASFTYTVTDGCGNTGTAIVYIDVEELPCDIEVEFESVPASCGLEDGAITVIVIGSGSFDYEWSNGDSGPTIQNVPPGGYIVTITDLNLGCTYEANTILEGLPADYVEDIEIIQPSCEAGGDIEFIALSPGQNILSMVVDHPNGSGVFDIEAGLIRLSDYVSTVPGEYFIEVSDPEAGPGCFESFSVTLEAPPLPQIMVVEVFPPSEPTAMDGSAFVEVTQPGQLPYAVYVNGLFAFTVNQNNFFLLGLGVGPYTVHIVDILGCQSNIVMFEVPFPDDGLSVGFTLTDAGSYSESNEQPTVYHPGKVWRSAFNGSYLYDIGKIQQEVRVLFAPAFSMNDGERVNAFMLMEYLSGPEDFRWKGIGLRAQAGIGTFIQQHRAALDDPADPVYWLIRASTEYTLLKRIHLRGSIAAKGWMEAVRMDWEFGFMVPFYSWTKRGGG